MPGSPEYRWIDGAENLEIYRKGGYHPIAIGNVLNGRYEIVDKLGYGGWSTVWLAHDSVQEHVWPVARIDGYAVPASVPSAAVVPIALEKRAEEFTLLDVRIILGDFGEAFIPAAKSRLGVDCHTPIDVRPPEAELDPSTPLSFSADIWSLALTIWDIIGMQKLISSDFRDKDLVLSQIVDIFGPLPSEWFKKWETKTRLFDLDGALKAGRELWPGLEQSFEQRVQKYRRQDGVGEFDRAETTAILEMITQMLKLRPETRISIEQVLECDWMAKWARVDHEQSLVAQLLD